jgi:hypothetical protein
VHALFLLYNGDAPEVGMGWGRALGSRVHKLQNENPHKTELNTSISVAFRSRSIKIDGNCIEPVSAINKSTPRQILRAAKTFTNSFLSFAEEAILVIYNDRVLIARDSNIRKSISRRICKSIYRESQLSSLSLRYENFAISMNYIYLKAKSLLLPSI